MLILKCTECGNTFKTENPKDNDIVTCPICEAEYRVQIRDGKIKLDAFIYEKEDLGEL